MKGRACFGSRPSASALPDPAPEFTSQGFQARKSKAKLKHAFHISHGLVAEFLHFDSKIFVAQ